jgi:hypothetical protein
MAAPHYVPSGAPIQGAKGQSQIIRTEFVAIETAIQVMNSIPFVVSFEDLNTNVPSAKSKFVSIPWAGNIVGAYVVNSVANSTTKTVITLEIATVLVTMPALEVAITAAIGTVASAVPTALNSVAAGGAVEVITDGGGAPPMPGTVTLLIART